MGGGGKGGGGSTPGYSGGSPEGDAYLAANPDVAESGMDPWYHYSQYGQHEGRSWGSNEDPMYDALMAAMESVYFMMEGLQNDEPDDDEYALDENGQFLLDVEGERILKTDVAYDDEGNLVRDKYGKWMSPAAYHTQQTDLSRRDELYGDYLDNASLATSYIDQQLLSEEANARLYGIKYEYTPEQRTQRVSDYFATIWGESDQQELQGLFDKYGNPEGFTGWTVKRGTPVVPLEDRRGTYEISKSGITPFDDEDEEESLLGG